MVLFVMLSLRCMVQKEGREGMCTSIREDNFWSIANTNLKGPYKIRVDSTKFSEGENIKNDKTN